MKKWIALTLMLLMTAGLLAACGGNKEPEDKTVDLATVYASMEEKQGWDENYMVDIEGEMLEYNYPGLSEISPKQFIAKMPMISSVVSEIVLMECETEEDAAKAAEILQARIDFQADGGAWYPESIEGWSKGSVQQNGLYVAMIAVWDNQSDLEDIFNQAFQ